MNLADNIQLMRKKNLWSQEELAEKCNVSRQAVAKWENGESVPNVEKLVLLADVFELSIDELVGRVQIDDYIQFKKYLTTHMAEDFPKDEEDDIAAIVGRYLAFVERMKLSPADKMQGLEEIFLGR